MTKNKPLSKEGIHKALNEMVKLGYLKKDKKGWKDSDQVTSLLKKGKTRKQIAELLEKEAKNKRLKFIGSCMCHTCPEKAVWFNVSKSGKTITAKYCESCYRTWAIPQKIGRQEGWTKK